MPAEQQELFSVDTFALGHAVECRFDPRTARVRVYPARWLDAGHWRLDWHVQFPCMLRQDGAAYAVELLVPRRSRPYYGVAGLIRRLPDGPTFTCRGRLVAARGETP